jgi:L-asparaginase/Glu-tRNA(Gln) amidotransferase subunit D
MKLNLEQAPEAKIGVVDSTPFLTPQYFDLMTKGVDAVIILAFASGTVPNALDETIKEKIDSNVPVFLVSKNPGDRHGIRNPKKYKSLIKTLKAGAIALQTVNINDVVQVGQAIQKAFATGKRGAELGKVIKDQFSLPIDSITNPEK